MFRKVAPNTVYPNYILIAPSLVQVQYLKNDAHIKDIDALWVFNKIFIKLRLKNLKNKNEYKKYTKGLIKSY